MSMKCCVTGHRPEGFPFPREADDYQFCSYREMLKDLILSLINEGFDYFITGMAKGADLDLAKAVIDLRDNFTNIKLEAALPYPIKSTQSPCDSTLEKRYCLKQCNIKTEVSGAYFRGCMQKRNRYMVDNSDMVIAIWNGEKKGGTWNTIQYAISKNKPVRYIMLNDIQTN